MQAGAPEGLGQTFSRFLISKSLGSVSFNLFEIYFLWDIVSRYRSVFLAGLIPTIILAVQLASSVPLGHVIDRANNTVLNFLSTIIMILGFLALSLPAGIYAIYMATAVTSLGFTLKGDSFSAILKRHLADEQVARGTSLNQMAIGVSQITGIAAGGFSLLFLRGMAPLILLGISVPALLLSYPATEAVTARRSEKTGAEYGRVISFYRKIAGFLIVALVLNGLFVGLDVYGSGLFRLFLHSTPEFYTMFVAAFPAGMILGSYVASRVLRYVDKPHMLALLVLLDGPLIFLLGASASAPADILVAGVLGFINPIINVPLNARLIRATPRDIFGRVFAFLRIFIGGSTPVMAAFFAVMSVYASVPVIFMGIGMLAVLVALFAFFAVPKFYEVTETEKMASP